MACKGCNCSGGCVHQQIRSLKKRCEKTDSNGKVFMVWNEFLGYELYCDLYPERYKKFSEENGSKLSTWVMDNVVMDCYEPNEIQKSLNEMTELAKDILDSIKEK